MHRALSCRSTCALNYRNLARRGLRPARPSLHLAKQRHATCLLIWGFTKIGDPQYIDPHIVGSTYKKDPNKVPLLSETPIWHVQAAVECGKWSMNNSWTKAKSPEHRPADSWLTRSGSCRDKALSSNWPVMAQ